MCFPNYDMKNGTSTLMIATRTSSFNNFDLPKNTLYLQVVLRTSGAFIRGYSFAHRTSLKFSVNG